MTDIAAAPPIKGLVRELRNREFPWTAATTYLNNASIGPIPERTRLALESFNARRTAPHLLPEPELRAGLVQAREAAARLIGAAPDEIALAFNTSTGINIAARGLPLERGDIVLVSDREFPANVYPWLRLADRGIATEIAPVTAQGFPDEDYLVERLEDPRVRVLAVSMVQFSNGWRADLDRLSAACRANGAYLVVDAIQGLGNSPLDVRDTPVDVLATGAQKWLLSPWGSGFVYVRRDLISAIEPATVGWLAFEGTDDYTNLVKYNPRLRQDARRFEIGTIPFQDVLGMRSSLELLLELTIEAIGVYVRELGEAVIRWARAAGVRIVSPVDPVHRSAIVCIAPHDPVAAFRQLKAAGIVCSLREGAIRLAPHCYNTIEEMEKVTEVLGESDGNG
ncbi:MAG TPA: aminotransferase class V-fold PLP-dependent enzyme [Gemmatimonadales bacterium]|nr:aminotransferase class V-fold PLP-dependent enzyme [Gemmatimonadales bacterium]